MTKVFKASSLAIRNNPKLITNSLQVRQSDGRSDHLKGGGSAELLEDDSHNLRVLTSE